MNNPSIILAAMSKAGYFFGWLPAAGERADGSKGMDQIAAGGGRGAVEAHKGRDEDVADDGDD